MDQVTQKNIEHFRKTCGVDDLAGIICRRYKPGEAAKILGVRQHFIINMAEKRIIEPAVEVRGRGKSREYSYKNLFQILLFRNLVDYLSYDQARKILSTVGRLPEGPEILNFLMLYMVTPVGETDPPNSCMTHVKKDTAEKRETVAFGYPDYFMSARYNLYIVNIDLIGKIKKKY